MNYYAIGIPVHKVVIFLVTDYMKDLQNLQQLPKYDHFQIFVFQFAELIISY